MTRDFSHILLLLSCMEKNLNRGKFGIYTRLMKEIDAVSLAPSELTESKIIFFVSCSWVSYCLSFLHLSEVYEIVFASAWRKIKTEEVIWVGRRVIGLQKGRAAGVQRQRVPCWSWGLSLDCGVPSLLFFAFYSVCQGKSWSLRFDIYFHWEHSQNTSSKRCDFWC